MVNDPSASKTDQVLNHIGLHRLSLRCVMDRLYFNGHPDGCNNLIQRLLNQGRVKRRDGLPGRLSYYQLSATEAAVRGVPVNRAKELGGQQIQTYLGVLWFCVMSDRRRQLLEPHHIQKMFPHSPPGGVHCLETGPPPRLLRVRVVGSKTRPSSVVHDLRGRLTDPTVSPKQSAAIRNRQYGFVVVTEFGQRRDLIDAAIDRSGLRALASIDVVNAPGHRTINQEITVLKKEANLESSTPNV